MHPTVEGIQRGALAPAARNALDLLVNLPLSDFNALKARMRLSVPGVIGPQTHAAFFALCGRLGLDLSPAGVNAFKAAHHLGNSGAAHGVIGPQTAAVYLAEILRRWDAQTAAPTGIDVSDFQGAVDWAAVARSGQGFAFAKATEGSDFVASTFAANWRGMKAAGLLRGAYHFYRPTGDAMAQAELFLRTVPHASGDLPPALDVEVGPVASIDSYLDGVQAWLDRVQVALGARPLLYTNPGFWEGALGNARRLGDHPLWIAHYGTDHPIVPGGFSDYVIHQYASDGKVDGVSGAVDVDRFHGDLEALRAMGVP